MFKKLLLICSLSTGLYNMPAIAMDRPMTMAQKIKIENNFKDLYNMIMRKEDMKKIIKEFVNLAMIGSSEILEVVYQINFSATPPEKPTKLYLGQAKAIIKNMTPIEVKAKTERKNKVITAQFNYFQISISMSE
jgi:hypothetical protein